ncbi:uncharacterized protein LOC110988777 isoform X1 [Acanthaster planci]|nr:uncharacterized protein LOC110988777 isoform X1 [Acanthaster planci]
MPEEGVPRPPGFPSESAVQNLREAGKTVGIDFTVRSQRIPWTVLAHTLLEFAKETDGGQMQNDLQEVIFKGYFTDGLLPDRENLLKFAEAVGLDIEKAHSFIQDKANQKKVYDRARYWARQGVTGVPTFYINGQSTFSGAQGTDIFTRMFERAATKFANQKLEIPANI